MNDDFDWQQIAVLFGGIACFLLSLYVILT
jgi:hypothetical protein